MGSNIFRRWGGGVGGPTFPRGGSNCLFPIETHITCDFQGGSDRAFLLHCRPSGNDTKP